MNRYFGLGIIFLSITASAAKAQPVVDSGLAEFTQVEFYAVGVEIVCTKAELDASGIKFDGTWSGDNTFTTSATWAFPGTVDSYEGRLFRSIRGRLQSRGLKVVGTDEDRDNTPISTASPRQTAISLGGSNAVTDLLQQIYSVTSSGDAAHYAFTHLMLIRGIQSDIKFGKPSRSSVTATPAGGYHIRAEMPVLSTSDANDDRKAFVVDLQFNASGKMDRPPSMSLRR